MKNGMTLQELMGDYFDMDAVISPEVIEFSMNMHLQGEIYLRMKDLGMTQKELAQKMGISPAAVSKLLSRDSNMRLSTIARIASALGCDVAPIKLVPGKEALEQLNRDLVTNGEPATHVNEFPCPDQADSVASAS